MGERFSQKNTEFSNRNAFKKKSNSHVSFFTNPIQSEAWAVQMLEGAVFIAQLSSAPL